MCGIANRITELREDKGLSINELATVLSQLYRNEPISKSMISRWERGVVMPQLIHAIHMAEFFNVSLDDLVGRRRRKRK